MKIPASLRAAEEHPLCVWLQGLLDRQQFPTCSTVKLLRIRSERVLLARHWPVLHVATSGETVTCQLCEVTSPEVGWPCLEWRTIAAGWAHLPGYDMAWVPGPQQASYLHLIHGGKR